MATIRIRTLDGGQNGDDGQTNFVEELYDKFLECRLCSRTYRQPKMLVCQHTFCAECLETHYEMDEQDRPYRFLLSHTRDLCCPCCRTRTPLPTGGVWRLPDNFLVANLADVIRRRRPQAATKSAGGRCEICRPSSIVWNEDLSGNVDVTKLATVKCVDCDKSLCANCAELHRETKVTSSHALFTITDDRDVECKIHRNETLRFYCEPCEQCVCVLCALHEHNEHDVSSLADGLERHRGTFDALLDDCRKHIDAVQQQLTLTDLFKSSLSAAEEHIRHAAIDAIADVRQRERELLDGLRNFVGNDAVQFVDERDALAVQLSELNGVRELTETMVGRTSVELLMTKKEVQERLRTVLDRQPIKMPDSVRLGGVRYVAEAEPFRDLHRPTSSFADLFRSVLNNNDNRNDAVVNSANDNLSSSSSASSSGSESNDEDSNSEDERDGHGTVRVVSEVPQTEHIQFAAASGTDSENDEDSDSSDDDDAEDENEAPVTKICISDGVVKRMVIKSNSLSNAADDSLPPPQPTGRKIPDFSRPKPVVTCVDRGTDMEQVVTTEAATATPRVVVCDKETYTGYVYLVHKNVSTDNQGTADKGTSTVVDVAAAYRNVSNSTRSTTCSRGMNTQKTMTTDRASSPVAALRSSAALTSPPPPQARVTGYPTTQRTGAVTSPPVSQKSSTSDVVVVTSPQIPPVASRVGFDGQKAAGATNFAAQRVLQVTSASGTSAVFPTTSISTTAQKPMSGVVSPSSLSGPTSDKFTPLSHKLATSHSAVPEISQSAQATVTQSVTSPSSQMTQQTSNKVTPYSQKPVTSASLSPATTPSQLEWTSPSQMTTQPTSNKVSPSHQKPVTSASIISSSQASLPALPPREYDSRLQTTSPSYVMTQHTSNKIFPPPHKPMTSASTASPSVSSQASLSSVAATTSQPVQLTSASPQTTQKTSNKLLPPSSQKAVISPSIVSSSASLQGLSSAAAMTPSQSVQMTSPSPQMTQQPSNKVSSPSSQNAVTSSSSIVSLSASQQASLSSVAVMTSKSAASSVQLTSPSPMMTQHTSNKVSSPSTQKAVPSAGIASPTVTSQASLSSAPATTPSQSVASSVEVTSPSPLVTQQITNKVSPSPLKPVASASILSASQASSSSTSNQHMTSYAELITSSATGLTMSQQKLSPTLPSNATSATGNAMRSPTLRVNSPSVPRAPTVGTTPATTQKSVTSPKNVLVIESSSSSGQPSGMNVSAQTATTDAPHNNKMQVVSPKVSVVSLPVTLASVGMASPTTISAPASTALATAVSPSIVSTQKETLPEQSSSSRQSQPTSYRAPPSVVSPALSTSDVTLTAQSPARTSSLQTTSSVAQVSTQQRIPSPTMTSRETNVQTSLSAETSRSSTTSLSVTVNPEKKSTSAVPQSQLTSSTAAQKCVPSSNGQLQAADSMSSPSLSSAGAVDSTAEAVSTAQPTATSGNQGPTIQVPATRVISPTPVSNSPRPSVFRSISMDNLRAPTPVLRPPPPIMTTSVAAVTQRLNGGGPANGSVAKNSWRSNR